MESLISHFRIIKAIYPPSPADKLVSFLLLHIVLSSLHLSLIHISVHLSFQKSSVDKSADMKIFLLQLFDTLAILTVKFFLYPHIEAPLKTVQFFPISYHPFFPLSFSTPNHISCFIIPLFPHQNT